MSTPILTTRPSFIHPRVAHQSHERLLSNSGTPTQARHPATGGIRVLKPRIVAETGVANGHSSFVILSALKANSQGKLVSIDIRKDVGQLVTAEESETWDLRLLARPGARDELRAVLQSVAPIDLFIHDSEHLYGWQMTEYRAAAAVLSHGGILVSDDVDSSYAMWDFCRERDLQPAVLIDDRKVLGLVSLREGKQWHRESNS